MLSFTGRYFVDLDILVINEWTYEKRDPKFICQRSSGVNDYIVEWWFIDNKYKLYFIPYHEFPFHNALEHGSIEHEVDTLHEVNVYSCTHLHPDFLQ
jgi:hypothetical protein